MSVLNRTRGTSLGHRVAVADNFFSRLRGLLGRPNPEEGEGLLILPSRGVHMYGMKYSLDVVLVDAKGQVVALYPELPPGARTRMHRTARAAVELPAGAIARSGTNEGDHIDWHPTPSASGIRAGPVGRS